LLILGQGAVDVDVVGFVEFGGGVGVVDGDDEVLPGDGGVEGHFDCAFGFLGFTGFQLFDGDGFADDGVAGIEDGIVGEVELYAEGGGDAVGAGGGDDELAFDG